MDSQVTAPVIQDQNTLQFEREEEDEPIQAVVTAERKVFADPGDPEIDSLYNKSKRGKLVLQPDFQRQFVWDTKTSSRLIESVLLDIPIPTIYLSEEQDSKEYVIDGQQRLTTFFSYIDGSFPDGREFKLIGLKSSFSQWNKKSYKELPDELQDKIKYYKIRTITFRKESDKDIKFDIFERLNSGSVSLNDQELRNCIYRGRYNILLKDLSEDPDFMYVLGLKKPDNRMRDIELALRFAAFYHSTYLNYKPTMRLFLNNDMERYQNISDSDMKDLKNAFKNTVMIIRSLFDDHAFKRFYAGDENNRNGHWEPKKFNASLYDVLMYQFAKEDKNKVQQNLDSIQEALIDLMTTDKEFIDSIELSTSSIQAVTKRFDKWRLTLQTILGIASKEPRCFSMKIKQELYDKDPNHTCAICGQRIQAIDDAAVDHIEQYWMGGKTIPENARLSHRFCNWSRPRKENEKVSNS